MINIHVLMDALDCSSVARQNDRIVGKAGWIYIQPEGFYMYCEPGSSRAWTFAKRALDFCKVTQDGDDEGFLLLDRLPTQAEADVIRDKLGLRKKRAMSEADKARLVRLGSKHRFTGDN